MGGFGLKHCDPRTSVALLRLLQVAYRDRLKRCIVLDAPSLFVDWLWLPLKNSGVIRPHTASLIEFKPWDDVNLSEVTNIKSGADNVNEEESTTLTTTLTPPASPQKTATSTTKSSTREWLFSTLTTTTTTTESDGKETDESNSRKAEAVRMTERIFSELAENRSESVKDKRWTTCWAVE